MSKIIPNSRIVHRDYVSNASFWDVFTFIITLGKKGRLYTIKVIQCREWEATLDLKTHVNCRCLITPVVSNNPTEKLTTDIWLKARYGAIYQQIQELRDLIAKTKNEIENGDNDVKFDTNFQTRHYLIAESYNKIATLKLLLNAKTGK